jgi:NAD-dependent deacetylase
MREICNIVVLTGAGLSAESGIPTFRTVGGVNYWDTADGTAYTIKEVCTPEALERDAGLVQRFYDGRRAALADVVPNVAHHALARLAAEWDGGLTIVTQNVDDLLERAGLPMERVWHMHGTLRSALCRACEARVPWDGALEHGPACPVCGVAALRPDIVFFGEMPHHMDAIEAALADADLFVSIGTSGAVYPAAGFVQTGRHYGAQTLELNLDPSAGSIFFDETRLGRAGTLVPEWVAAMLAVGALR